MLTKLQKKQYEDIKQRFEHSDGKYLRIDEYEYIAMRDVFDLLTDLGYIRDAKPDGCHLFYQLGNLKDFEAYVKDQEQEEKKLTLREWCIAIVSAIIGAIIGLTPTIVTWFR